MVEIGIDDKDFQKKLSEFCDKLLPEVLEKAMEQACLTVQRQAQKNCPVDNGQLRASITYEVEIADKDAEGVVGTDFDYAPYAHEGTGIYAANGNGRQTSWTYQKADGTWCTTKGQRPNPFLKKAVNETKSDILKCFEGVI